MGRQQVASQSVIDMVEYASLHGSRVRGNRCTKAEENGEDQQAYEATLRRWLGHMFGNPTELADLLDVVGGRVSLAELARAHGIPRRTLGRQIERSLQKARQVALAAESAMEALAEDRSGCTIDCRQANAIHGIDAWAVSLHGFEERHDLVTFAVLCAYVRRHSSLLLEGDELFLGLWHDGKQVCLDITGLFPDEVTAMAHARMNNQIAITNLRDRRTLYLDEEEERKAA